MTDRYRRDVRGRFTRVDVSNTPLAADSKFGSTTDLNVSSGVPETFAYDTEHRYAPGGDTLAGYGPSYGASRLRARNPVLVHPDDADHTVYGRQGAVLRTAARGSTPMDPSGYLVGLEAHRTRLMGAGKEDGSNG